MELRIMTPEEQKYAFSQSQQLVRGCGGIGYLRGDFASSGKEFFTTWFDHYASRKTDKFNVEFDDVINALRSDEQYGGILKDRNAMNFYCANQPGSRMESRYNDESFGFRADTENYAYLIRCNPQKDDYNFCIFPYIAKWLDLNIEQASKGIRFINPNYKEIFRIPDGDKVRITTSDGIKEDSVCRYIDDYHLKVGINLYHICELAESIEQNGNKIVPLRSSLPEQCYSTLQDTGAVVILNRGETGYYKTDIQFTDKADAKAIAEEHNGLRGVSKAQEEAMKAGSMFGFEVTAADPKNYDDNGKPINPAKKKERGDER
ncbi:MAG: hypothetical protein RSD35_08135 [Oscillospiraceae bacterium]